MVQVNLCDRCKKQTSELGLVMLDDKKFELCKDCWSRVATFLTHQDNPKKNPLSKVGDIFKKLEKMD